MRRTSDGSGAGARRDRVALVCGGSRGIGLATATRLRESGRRVAVLSRSGGDLGDLLSVRCDLTEADDVDAAVREVEDRLGPVEVLVANAGTTEASLLARTSDASFHGLVRGNLFAAFHATLRVVPGMTERGWGRLVFLSSVAATVGVPGQSGYAAAKAALTGLARSLAREVAPHGVTVNVVLPGFVETELTRRVPDRVRDGIRAQVPLGRFGRTREVAAAVDFLAGEQAGYITGALVPVDGGQGMGW
ncbi:SDR family NAD(P)-dependent oxidoreductase [Streptomyces naphthomycinicus]|uniref:SDR family NAD(P)-dependent oxidoreductase n=1 Tax=Streptomyces naphthomycinicus TaxID=2872625 RepID=UPI001CEDBC0D|nr:SDR family oxidoreductase [Streptomyces sp. TML10]